MLGAISARAGYLCRQVHHSESGLRWKPAVGYFMSLRTNPKHFWSFARKQADALTSDKSALLTEGLITGDFHYQNMAARRTGEKLKVDFMDLDDGGQGPFVFDMVRFLVTAKAIEPGIDQAGLIKAYNRGVREKKDDRPERVQEVMDLPAKKIHKRDREFLEKNTDGNEFNYERLGLTKLQDSPVAERRLIQQTAAKLGRLFRADVMSAASRRRLDGGSQGYLRVWALLRNEAGLRIFEAKELGEPALNFWSPQKDAAERLPELMEAYWGESVPEYGILRSGGRNFWFRPRVKKHFRTDVPSLRDHESRKVVAEEILYFANYLGRRHGAQKSAEAYRELIENDPEMFTRALQDFVSTYDREARHQYKLQAEP